MNPHEIIYSLSKYLWSTDHDKADTDVLLSYLPSALTSMVLFYLVHVGKIRQCMGSVIN